MLAVLVAFALVQVAVAMNLLVDSDASGQYLVGVSFLKVGSYPSVVISNDYGQSWNATQYMDLNIVGVSSSSNGRTLLALPACKKYDSICAPPHISLNRGATWAPTAGFDMRSTLYCFDMEVTDGVLVVNCHDSSAQRNNVYTSGDGGLTWTKAANLDDKPPTGLYGKLLAASKKGQFIATVNEGNVLMRSDTIGFSWTETSLPLPVVSLAMDDSGSKLLAFYASSTTQTAGLLASSDGGETWTDAQQFPYSGEGLVVSNPTGDRALLRIGGTTDDHLYLFDGSTTKPLLGSPVEGYLSVAADDSFTHIIAATNAGFYCSHDGGATWQLAYKNPN